MSNAEIYRALGRIDHDEDYSVDDYDANFLETLKHWKGPITLRQRAHALRMIERWEARRG